MGGCQVLTTLSSLARYAIRDTGRQLAARYGTYTGTRAIVCSECAATLLELFTAETASTWRSFVLTLATACTDIRCEETTAGENRGCRERLGDVDVIGHLMGMQDGQGPTAKEKCALLATFAQVGEKGRGREERTDAGCMGTGSTASQGRTRRAHTTHRRQQRHEGEGGVGDGIQVVE